MEPCFIHIRLHQQGHALCFEVENRIFHREAKGSRHLGIENCRKRLSLLYPGRHRLDIATGEDQVFRVRLELQSPSAL